MDNPTQDIESVIRNLTQSSPSVQRATIDKYFTPDAAFIHPFCRTGTFDGSRLLIRAIYRWYKIMSPRIELSVKSIAYDSTNLMLYVTMSQIFSIWIIPFHKSTVTLTTVLQLKHDKLDHKYYIASQNDLYQTDQFVRFPLPHGYILVWLWQFFATLQCVILAWLFTPLSWIEPRDVNGVSEKQSQEANRTKTGGLIEAPKGSGNFVTAPAFEQ